MRQTGLGAVESNQRESGSNRCVDKSTGPAVKHDLGF